MSIDYIEGGGHTSPQDVHIFNQATAPTVAQGVEVGDLWSDTTASLLKRCTAISPVTFASTEGGSTAHTLDSATHSDVAAATEAKGMVLAWDSVAGAWTALAVGTDGQQLEADSTQDIGVKWAAAGGTHKFSAPTTLTLVTNDITPTGDNHLVAGEGAANDEIDGIAAGADGDILLLRASTDAYTITIRHNQNAAATNNILLQSGQNFELDLNQDVILLVYDAALDTNGAWFEVSRGFPQHGMLGGVNANQHHAQAHSLASHSSEAHAELTGVGIDDHHAESHTVVSHSDTTATGPETETLTDGSNADALHAHDLSAQTETLTNKTINDLLNLVHADATHVAVRNETGATLTMGAPVYVSGFSAPESLVLVALADADGSGTMPAIGLVEADIANNANGKILVEGILSGINTSAFSVGDVIYISTTPGGFTATKPSGASDLIQNIGVVLRSHATLGIFVLEGAGRTNDVPNTVFPIDDTTSDPLPVDATAAADGTEDSFARKDHRHLGHAEAHAAAQHNAAALPASANENLGAFYLDVDDIATPANPGATIRRVFVDTADGKLKVRTNAGSSVSLEEQGGGATFGVPTGDVDIGDAAAEGASGDSTRADHQHAFPAPSASYPLDVAAAESDGTASTPARSDHVHSHGSGYSSTAHQDEVTLAGTPSYITIAAQVITRALINLTSHITGVLPIANGGTNLSALPDVEVPISASSLKGTATAGAGDADSLPESAEAPTNDVNYDYMAFDTTTEENAFFQFSIPSGWDEGTITFRVKWTNTAGLTTETVVMGLKALALSNDEALDTAWGTEVTVTDTWLAQNDVHISPESAAVTIGGTPAEGDLILFNLARKTASDNLTGDARILEVIITFTRGSYTD